MNILFRIGLLVLIINFVTVTPGPLAASEARPDTFVVAKIPGARGSVTILFNPNSIRGSGHWRG